MKCELSFRAMSPFDPPGFSSRFSTTELAQHFEDISPFFRVFCTQDRRPISPFVHLIAHSNVIRDQGLILHVPRSLDPLHRSCYVLKRDFRRCETLIAETPVRLTKAYANSRVTSRRASTPATRRR